MRPAAADTFEPVASTPEKLGMAWYALAILVGAYLVAYVDKQVLAVAAGPIARSLGLSDPQIGMVQGLGFALFSPLVMIPIGWLVDKVRRPAVLSAGIAIWSISTAACGFAHDYPTLLIASIGIAIGEAVLSPVAYALITDVFPRRLWVTGNIIFFAAALMGVSVGFASAGGVLDWFTARPRVFGSFIGEPWRATMVAVALPGPILAAMALLIRARRSSSEAAAPLLSDMTFGAFLRLRKTIVAPLILANALMQAALAAQYSWLPLALPRRFDITPSLVGYQLGLAVAIGSLAGVGIAYLISRRLKEVTMLSKPLLIGAWTYATAGFVSLGWFSITAPWQGSALTGTLIGMGMGASSLLPGVLQFMSPNHLRGRLAGISALIAAAGAGFGPLLVGGLSGSAWMRGNALAAIGVVNLLGWSISAALMARSYRAATRMTAEI